MRKLEKEKQLQKRKAEVEAKEALKAIPPKEFFKLQMSDKYSKFDNQVTTILYFLSLTVGSIFYFS